MSFRAHIPMALAIASAACTPKSEIVTSDTVPHPSTSETATTETPSSTSTDLTTQASTPATSAVTEPGSTTDSGGVPSGCGDGVPEEDVYCFTKKDFPDIHGELRVAGDFNGDGHADLALKNIDVVHILLGDGSGDLTLGSDVLLGEVTLSSAVFNATDFDSDSDIDLQIVSNFNLLSLLNDGSGQFTLGMPIPLPAASNINFMDASGDGLPDVVFTNDANELRILKNLGSSFTLEPYAGLVLPCYSSAVAPVALDEDGFLDLLVASSCNDPPAASPVRAFTSTGQSSFVQDDAQILVGADPVAIVISDVNGDSVTDAVTANQASDDISIVLRDGGGFQAELRVDGICAGCERPQAIAAGDFDGTGVADELILSLWAPGPSLGIVLFLNPLGGMPKKTVLLEMSAPAIFEVADWNEDGVADLAAVGPDLSLTLFLSNP